MAVDTVNEAWRDALIRHQIGLSRVSGGVRNQILAILNATEQDLAEAIRSRLIGVDFGTGRGTARLKALQAFIEGLRHDAFTEISQTLTAEMNALASSEVVFLRGALATVSPVLLDTLLPAPDLLRNIVTRRPFQGRLLRDWVRDLERADRKRIMDQIRIGLVQGQSTPAIARRVVGTARLNGTDGATQFTRRGAVALVRTSITHINNAAAREFSLANSSTFKFDIYSATLDGRTTPICRSLDGKRFPLGEGPFPPMHISCRSFRVSVIDDKLIGVRPARAATQRGLLREYAQRNGLGSVRRRSLLPRGHKGNFDAFARRRLRELTGTVPPETTYGTWLRGQSLQFQNDVLGVTKARLFRRGGLDLDRFVNRRGDELTLSQLATLERQAFISAGLDPEDFL